LCESAFPPERYEPDITALQNHWRTEKHNRGRALATMTTAAKAISVFAIRTGAQWDFHYQVATDIHSVRTGLKAKIKGTSSDKFKLVMNPLPAVPPGGVPNP
jgi:hypothetical protein